MGAIRILGAALNSRGLIFEGDYTRNFTVLNTKNFKNNISINVMIFQFFLTWDCFVNVCKSKSTSPLGNWKQVTSVLTISNFNIYKKTDK